MSTNNNISRKRKKPSSPKQPQHFTFSQKNINNSTAKKRKKFSVFNMLGNNYPYTFNTPTQESLNKSLHRISNKSKSSFCVIS